MISEIKSGPQTASDGSILIARSSKDGSMVAQDSHGRYQEAVYRGAVYTACNQAAVTFGVGLSATVATLSLTNPVGSGKNLVLLNAGFALSAAPAAAAMVALVLQPFSTTAVTHTTPVIVRNALWTGTGAGNVGLVDSAATLAAVPIYALPLMAVTGAAALTPPAVFVEVAGSLILTPGTAVAFQANAAAAGFCSLSWEEIAI